MNTPKIKIRAAWFFVLGALVCSFFWFSPIIRKKFYSPPAAHVEGSSFFIPISIAGFSNDNIPCVNVLIENKEFLFRLDLGLNSQASMQKESLLMVSDKLFEGTITSGGFRGNPYQIHEYLIPGIKIKELQFHPVLLREENPVLSNESRIGKERKEPLGPIVGKIGWKLFNKTCLFIDLNHSMMIVSDSIDTFKKYGPSCQNFAKASLIKEHDAVEIETITSKGILRCILDTGCTFDIINSANQKNKPLEEMLLKKTKFTSFQIGNQDFGPMALRKLPLKLPFHIDAILGMEFLSKHAVLIDFVNNEIYFGKTSDHL